MFFAFVTTNPLKMLHHKTPIILFLTSLMAAKGEKIWFFLLNPSPLE